MGLGLFLVLARTRFPAGLSICSQAPTCRAKHPAPGEVGAGGGTLAGIRAGSPGRPLRPPPALLLSTGLFAAGARWTAGQGGGRRTSSRGWVRAGVPRHRSIARRDRRSRGLQRAGRRAASCPRPLSVSDTGGDRAVLLASNVSPRDLAPASREARAPRLSAIACLEDVVRKSFGPVRALDGVDLRAPRGARSSRCSGRTAPASRPRSRSCSGLRRPDSGRALLFGARSSRRRRPALDRRRAPRGRLPSGAARDARPSISCARTIRTPARPASSPRTPRPRTARRSRRRRPFRRPAPPARRRARARREARGALSRRADGGHGRERAGARCCATSSTSLREAAPCS